MKLMYFGIMFILLGALMIVFRDQLTGNTSELGPLSITLPDESSEQNLFMFGGLLGALGVGMTLIGFKSKSKKGK